jgi:hypothetical protein
MSTALDEPVLDDYFDVDESDFTSTAVDGGETKITLEPLFQTALASAGIEVEVTGSGSSGQEDYSYRLPVTGGEIVDEQYAALSGELEHYGSGLSFRKDGITVDFSDFILNTATGQVSGEVMVRGMDTPDSPYDSEPAVFSLDDSFSVGATSEAEMQSDNLVLDGVRLCLTDEAAGILNLAFKSAELSAEMLCGTASVRVDVVT